jgi:hypothetical protein
MAYASGTQQFDDINSIAQNFVVPLSSAMGFSE